MDISGQWFVIINPAAESGRILNDRAEIESLLYQENLSFEAVFTQHKYHAVELTVDAVNRGFRRIIVVGGDGTLHEVVNGLFIQKCVPVSEVAIGIIPALSISHHARLKAIPSEYLEAVKAIASGYFSLLDIITVSYHKASYRQSRQLITSARTGLDANIVKRMTHLREEGRYGGFRQWLAAVKLIFDYRQPKTTVHIDGHKITFSGLTSGMIRIPRKTHKNAESEKIEIAALGTVGRWLLTLNIKRLRNGRLYNMKNAIRHYGNTIHIESDSTIALAADGEMLGYSPIDFTMAEQPVKIILPRKSAQYSPTGKLL